MIDLARRPAKGRVLGAGYLLGAVEFVDSAIKGDKRARRAVKREFANLTDALDERIRDVAEFLAPGSVEHVVEVIRECRSKFGRNWFEAVGAQLESGDLIPSEEPLPTVTATKVAAWAPLSAFLSHSSKDKEIVRRLWARLTEVGHIDIFLDEREVGVADVLAPTLKDNICQSDFLIAVCSSHSRESQWFWKEVEWAEELGVAVVPVRLDDSPMPEQFDDLIYADLRELHCFEQEAMRIVYALTGNPVLRHLPSRTPTSLIVDWDQVAEDELQKTTRATLRIENKSDSPFRSKVLKLTTIAYWNFPEPVMSSYDSDLRVDGKWVSTLVRAAPNSESVISLDTIVHPGNLCEIKLLLYTDHVKGYGIGLNLFLIGCEVHMEGGLHATVRPMLLDLHGKKIDGYTLGYLTSTQMSEAIEMAKEIERIMPPDCVMGDVLANELRSIRVKSGGS